MQSTSKRVRRFSLAKPLLLAVAILLFWEFSGSVRILNPVQFPSVTLIAPAFWKGVSSGSYLLHAAFTLYGIAISFTLAMIGGITIGLLIGRYLHIARTLEPFIYLLYPVPMIAFIGVFIVWFGTGDTIKIGITALSAFFPVVVNTIVGVRTINPTLIRVGRDLGVSELQLLKDIIFPASLPVLFGGLRLAIGLSILSTVIIEMLFNPENKGLGFLLEDAAFLFQPDKAFAVAVVVAVLGVSLTALVERSERKIIPWRAG